MQAPATLLFAMGLAMAVTLASRLLSAGPLLAPRECVMFGSIAGAIGLGPLLHPLLSQWISSDALVFLVVLATGVAYRVHLGRSGGRMSGVGERRGAACPPDPRRRGQEKEAGSVSNTTRRQACIFHPALLWRRAGKWAWPPLSARE